MVRVGKDFCPRIEQGEAHFAWGTPPDIELVGHSCLEIGRNQVCVGPWKFPAGKMMTGQINHALQGQVDEINKKIPCDQIRNQLQQVWKTWSFPVPITNPPTYVALQPKALSVPGVIATDDGIRLIARLDATTAVSADKPPSLQQPPLPATATTGQAVRLANLPMTTGTNGRRGRAVAAPVNRERPRAIGPSYGYDFPCLLREAKRNWSRRSPIRRTPPTSRSPSPTT